MSRNSNLKVNIREPNITDDKEPMIVSWGKFYGLKEKTGGAFYFDIPAGETDFNNLLIALFEKKGKVDEFSSSNPPSTFSRMVEKREGANNSLKQSAFDLCREVFKEYIFKRKNNGRLRTILLKSKKSELVDFFDELFSNYIRKGKLEFDVSAQLVSENELNNSVEKLMQDDDAANKKSNSGSSEKESEKNYHRVSLVTSPLKGLSPHELNPGDEIYIRALGGIATKFPDEMQSEKYDNTTVPLEAVVEAIQSNPSLPSDYDGNSADYVEVRTCFGNKNFGRGFVYKEERIKPVHTAEESSGDGSLVPRILLAVGLTLAVLAVIAWVMFG
jgi:hypothetical protein